jgi:hypothetical protein
MDGLGHGAGPGSASVPMQPVLILQETSEIHRGVEAVGGFSLAGRRFAW